jgi:hypothetical protein
LYTRVYGERKKQAQDKGPSDNPNIGICASVAIVYTTSPREYTHTYSEYAKDDSLKLNQVLSTSYTILKRYRMKNVNTLFI